MKDYAFPGMTDHVLAAAASQGLTHDTPEDPKHTATSEVKRNPVLAKVQDALGAIGDLHPLERQGVLDRAVGHRWKASVLLESIDAAIKEVADAFDLDFEPLKLQPAKPNKAKKATPTPVPTPVVTPTATPAPSPAATVAPVVTQPVTVVTQPATVTPAATPAAK